MIKRTHIGPPSAAEIEHRNKNSLKLKEGFLLTQKSNEGVIDGGPRKSAAEILEISSEEELQAKEAGTNTTIELLGIDTNESITGEGDNIIQKSVETGSVNNNIEPQGCSADKPETPIKEKDANILPMKFDLRNPIAWGEWIKVFKEKKEVNRESIELVYADLSTIFGKDYSNLGFKIFIDRPKRQSRELFKYSYDTIVEHQKNVLREAPEILSLLTTTLQKIVIFGYPQPRREIFDSKNIQSTGKRTLEYNGSLNHIKDPIGQPTIQITLPYCKPADSILNATIEEAVSFVVGQVLGLLTPLMPWYLIRIEYASGSKEAVPKDLKDSIIKMRENIKGIRSVGYNGGSLTPEELQQYISKGVAIHALHSTYKRYILSQRKLLKLSGSVVDINKFLTRIVTMEAISNRKVRELKASQIQDMNVKCARHYSDLKKANKSTDDIQKINPYGPYEELFDADMVIINFDVLVGDKTTEKISKFCGENGNKRIIITVNSDFAHDGKHQICKDFLENVSADSALVLGSAVGVDESKNHLQLMDQIVSDLLEDSPYRSARSYEVKKHTMDSVKAFVQEFDENNINIIIQYFREHGNLIYTEHGIDPDKIKSIFIHYQLKYNFNTKKVSNLIEEFADNIQAGSVTKRPNMTASLYKAVTTLKEEGKSIQDLRERLHINAINDFMCGKVTTIDEKNNTIRAVMDRLGFGHYDSKMIKERLGRSNDGFVNILLDYFFLTFLSETYVNKVFSRTLSKKFSPKGDQLELF